MDADILQDSIELIKTRSELMNDGQKQAYESNIIEKENKIKK